MFKLLGWCFCLQKCIRWLFTLVQESRELGIRCLCYIYLSKYFTYLFNLFYVVFFFLSLIIYSVDILFKLSSLPRIGLLTVSYQGRFTLIKVTVVVVVACSLVAVEFGMQGADRFFGQVKAGTGATGVCAEILSFHCLIQIEYLVNSYADVADVYKFKVHHKTQCSLP